MFCAPIPQIFNKFSFQFKLAALLVFTKGNLSYLFTGKPSRWWQRSAVFVCRIVVSTIVFRIVDVLKNIFSSVVIFGLGRSVRLFGKKWSDLGSQGCFSGFCYEFFLLLPITFFFKYVRLEICNIQSHNYLLTKTLSLWSVRCYNLNPFFPFVPLSSADKISHVLPADSLVLFDLMLLLLCCSTRTNHSLGDLFDVDIFKSFTSWSLGPVQVSLLRCIFLCV